MDPDDIGMSRPRRASCRAVRWLLFAAALALGGCAQTFDLQGHRGARGLAPENTLAAFATALRIGVTTLEFDLGVTRDGMLVVSHDSRLNGNFTRDAGGAWVQSPGPMLRQLPLAELQRYDVGRLRPGTRYAETFAQQRPYDGQRIPTLDEVFERVAAWQGHRIRFNIETKLTPTEPELTPEPAAFAQLVVDALRRHRMTSRATVQSFDWRTLLAVKRLAPEITTVALTARQSWLDNLADGRWTAGLQLADHGQSVPRLVKASGASVWSPHHGDVTAALIEEAHALGLGVVPWTVNEPAQIDKLLGWGVDGLISDYPDRVRRVLAARGMALPPPLDVPDFR